MKKRFSVLLLFVWALPCVRCFCDAPCEVTARGDRIYCDGKLFFVKGLCYSPYDPGNGFGAVTFQFFSEERKKQDFQMMKDAGFNTIRLYEAMPNGFYEYAKQYGFKVIEPVLRPEDFKKIDKPEAIGEYRRQALKRVKQMKNHPVILMWSLWNDAPFEPNIAKRYTVKQIDAVFKQVFDAIKEEDPHHLVTGANMVNVEKGFDMGFSFLDVIGCQAYIGLDHAKYSWNNMEFSKVHAKESLHDLESFSRKWEKPLLITETGFSTSGKKTKQGEVLEEQLKLIGESLAGVCIFEWTDEWWKAGKEKTQDGNIEEYWGILDAYRKPKQGFETVKKYFPQVDTESKGFSRELFDKTRNGQNK